MKVIILAFTSTKYDGHGIKIDRPDLTRKMSCLETWVPRMEEKNCEVIFFDGGFDHIHFDARHKILHCTSNESYDYHWFTDKKIPSLMLERLKEAIKWVMENREFDYIFRTDDCSYINAFAYDEIVEILKQHQPDWLSGPSAYGGGGYFFSKNFCEKLVAYENTDKVGIEDLSILHFIGKTPGIRRYHHHSMLNQYVVGENYFSIHYANGERMHFVDMIMSYYHNSTPIDRKIVVNYCDNDLHNKPMKCNTFDFDGGITPHFYSFDRDNFNWEHYGCLSRANYVAQNLCPFAKGGVKELFFHEVEFDLSNQHILNVFMKYIESLKDGGVMYFFYQNTTINEEILKYMKLVEQHNEVNINIEYLKNKKGNFYKLEKI